MRFLEHKWLLQGSLWLSGAGFAFETILPYEKPNKIGIFLVSITLAPNICILLVQARLYSLVYRVREEARWIFGVADACSFFLAMLCLLEPTFYEQ